MNLSLQIQRCSTVPNCRISDNISCKGLIFNFILTSFEKNRDNPLYESVFIQTLVIMQFKIGKQ